MFRGAFPVQKSSWCSHNFGFSVLPLSANRNHETQGQCTAVSATCTFRSAVPLQQLAMKPTRRFFAVRGQAMAIAGTIPVATAPEVKASKLLVPEPMVCSFSSEQLPFPNLVNIHTSGNLHWLHPRAGSGEIYEQQRMAG
jgi:hypothetical protein